MLFVTRGVVEAGSRWVTTYVWLVNVVLSAPLTDSFRGSAYLLRVAQVDPLSVRPS
jgi:hypothetical protein